MDKEGQLHSPDLSAEDHAGRILGQANYDQNFNALNLDLVYSWQFAQGSFMNVVWKNAILTSDQNAAITFFDNLGRTLSRPSSNSFSIRIIYFLDYLQVRRLFSGRE